MKIITTEKKPIKLWLEDMEEGAMEQAKNLANLPFLHKHVAIMPDSHLGYGMPIGGVIATKDVIIPNAVGVDIGCGMCAVNTHLKLEDVKPHLKDILGEIRKVIPVGKNSHKEKQNGNLMPQIEFSEDSPVIYEQYQKARTQLGTLGGGNHFVEIQKDKDDFIWIMIHSGSRNLGFTVANFYNKEAIALNKKWHSVVPEKQQLAFLPTETFIARQYIKEMNYCVKFALANRKLMMERTLDSFKLILKDFTLDNLDEVMINIAHNYASLENHYGENVWVHRKGATLASEGTVGIIPGSQGTKSYIVSGKGNPESFNSCSHGAGRKLGRRQAERTLDLDAEVKKLDDQGILHSIRGVKQLDEAVGAYKDIDVVMENQKDLVDILVELSPLAVLKG